MTYIHSVKIQTNYVSANLCPGVCHNGTIYQTHRVLISSVRRAWAKTNSLSGRIIDVLPFFLLACVNLGTHSSSNACLSGVYTRRRIIRLRGGPFDFERTASVGRAGGNWYRRELSQRKTLSILSCMHWETYFSTFVCIIFFR